MTQTTAHRAGRACSSLFASGLFVALLTTGYPAHADDQSLRQQIVGSWGNDESCQGVRLTFREDGTAAMFERMTGSQSASSNGRYVITDGMVTVTDAAGTTLLQIPHLRIEGAELSGQSENGRIKTIVRCADAAVPSR